MTAAATEPTPTPPAIDAALLIRPDAWPLVRSMLDSSGLVVVSDPIGAHQIPRYVVSASAPRLGRSAMPLTDRELQVLKLIALGNENDEAAAALFLSPNTVKTHIKHIMTKLGARSRAQCVAVAYERGILGGAS